MGNDLQSKIDIAKELKHNFEEIRKSDYQKALDFWKPHFHKHGSTLIFYYPINIEDDFSPREFIDTYPEYCITCLPRKVNGKYDPLENEIFIHWYMEIYKEIIAEANSPSEKQKTILEDYNFNKQKSIIEENLKRSTNKIGSIEKKLNAVLKIIESIFRDKKEKEIFEELDDNGNEPDWRIATETTAETFIKVKYYIECREYLKGKLEELKHSSKKSNNSIEKEFRKLKWNDDLNKLTTLFFELTRRQSGDKSTLETNPKNLINFIMASFLDKNGKEIKKSVIETYLKPERNETRSKKNKLDLNELTQT